jgi:polyribonucleotide 5'-hydroxyl-kinase
MPVGMKTDETRTKLVSVTPTASALLHHLLAISFASSPTDEEPVKKNVVGYVCVTEVDMEKGRMTVLSPQPGPLPKLVLLLSDIQFMDSQ